MIQLLLHLLGDYVLQSHWMAQNKGKCSYAAAAHAITYSLPFLLLRPSWLAFAVILITHFLIDRYRLARSVVWFKNVALDPATWACRPELEAEADGGNQRRIDQLERLHSYRWA